MRRCVCIVCAAAAAQVHCTIIRRRRNADRAISTPGSLVKNRKARCVLALLLARLDAVAACPLSACCDGNRQTGSAIWIIASHFSAFMTCVSSHWGRHSSRLIRESIIGVASHVGETLKLSEFGSIRVCAGNWFALDFAMHSDLKELNLPGNLAYPLKYIQWINISALKNSSKKLLA